MFANEAAVVYVHKYAHQEPGIALISAGSSAMGNRSTYWQSIRSVIPPWPGMLSPKSLILKARLKPEAKKPPNGATSEAKHAMDNRWN